MNWFDDYQRIKILMYLICETNWKNAKLTDDVKWDISEKTKKINYKEAIINSNMINEKNRHDASKQWKTYKECDYNIADFNTEDQIFNKNKKKGKKIYGPEIYSEKYFPIKSHYQYVNFKQTWNIILWLLTNEYKKYNNFNQIFLWLTNTIIKN